MKRLSQRGAGARRVAVVLSAATVLTVAAIGPGRTLGATCDGHLAAIGNDASYQMGPVTIDRSTSATAVVIIGSEGNDTLKGGSGDDFICGRGGDDHIEGGGGQDTLYGDSGSDRIIGGNGVDKLFGGWGLDDYIDARDTPAADDSSVDGGFGIKHCDVDVADTHVENCKPPIATFLNRTVGLNPFPLPPP